MTKWKKMEDGLPPLGAMVLIRGPEIEEIGARLCDDNSEVRRYFESYFGKRFCIDDVREWGEIEL